MRLNTLSPAEGAKHAPKRVGRGIGSGLGKTCGRGHKGQNSRSGGGVRRGFEGGQMPLQRRLPKFGFVSRKAEFVAEVRLSELASMEVELIDLDALKAANIIGTQVKSVKIILSGEINRAITLRSLRVAKSAREATLGDLRVTKGAQAAIEAAGGKIEKIEKIVIAEVRLSRLAKMESDVIDLGTLKAANVVDTEVESVKVVLPGKINRAITLHGLRISPSARAVIEAAGGKIEE